MKYISHIRAVIAESDAVEFLQLGALFIDLVRAQSSMKEGAQRGGIVGFS